MNSVPLWKAVYSGPHVSCRIPPGATIIVSVVITATRIVRQPWIRLLTAPCELYHQYYLKPLPFGLQWLRAMDILLHFSVYQLQHSSCFPACFWSSSPHLWSLWNIFIDTFCAFDASFSKDSTVRGLKWKSYTPARKMSAELWSCKGFGNLALQKRCGGPGNTLWWL